MVRPLDVECMDETGHWYKFFCYQCILRNGRTIALRPAACVLVFGFFQFRRLAGEAQAITVCQVDVEVMVAVGCLLEVDGNVGGSAYFGHVFRAGDVLVVCDTAVFVHLHREVVVHGLHLIAFADIAGKEAGVEEGCRLVGVVAASVEVIDVESESQALVGVHREVGLEALFTVHLAACLVVGQVREGDVAVREAEVAGAEQEAGVGGQKHGRFPLFPLEKHARQARTAQVAQVVVVPLHAFYEVRVLEVQVQRVGGNAPAVAQAFVQLPLVEAWRRSLYVGAVVLQVVRLSRGVYLVAVLVAQCLTVGVRQRLLCQGGTQSQGTQQQVCQCESFQFHGGKDSER